MTTEFLPTHTPVLFNAAVKRAAELLRAGELVALPTETVYGLAANALDTTAVAKIFEAKGRPAHNPIIVHVASVEMAARCVRHWPAVADKLAKSFWPGPLSMVLPRAKEIPDIVTAGGRTVGVRWPSHPFIQAVIRECGFPLAAPSANLANQVSPTNAGHVRKQLGEKLRLIVDGGQSQVGIESTVIDLTTEPPTVLRPGMIHEESLIAVCGDLVSHQRKKLPGSGPLRSPGMLERHYAPRARLVVVPSQDLEGLNIQHPTSNIRHPKTFVIAHTHIPKGLNPANVSVIPHDAEAFARALYAELHRCDAAGAEWIVVEEVPPGSEWRAIADRLKRAATT